MSSIFSDPFFRRGTTLLSGETIEYAVDGTTPSQGTEVVGQVKVFQDVNPSGDGARYSNRLVYCVAARYIGNDTTGTNLRRKLVKFTSADSLASFGVSNQIASVAELGASDANTGIDYGVVDEYLPADLPIRKNDIVWVVLKGPVTVSKTTGTDTATAAGAGVKVGATNGTAHGGTAAGTSAAYIGTCIAKAALTTTDATMRVNLWSDRI